jgi:uncharacterized protein (DUF885 family)
MKKFKMKPTVSFIFYLLMLFSITCKQNDNKTKQSKENLSIDNLLAAYSEETLKAYPILATKSGDNRYNDKLPNYLDLACLDSLKAMYARYKNELKKFNKNSLNENQRMSYDVLLWECNIRLEAFNINPGLIAISDGINFSFSYLPIDQFWSTNLFMGQLAGGKGMQPFKTVADYDNWLKRVDDFMVWCDTAIENMKKGMSTGIVLPKALIKKIIPQMESFSKGPVKDHIFYKPILSMPKEFSDSDKKRLTLVYTKMVEEKVIPEFRKLHDFISKDYLQAGRESSGFCALANGEKAYNYLIKYFTTTNMTADEIFKLGESEVARIQGEMEKVKEKLHFHGNLKAFFEYVRTDRVLMPYTDPQQVIDNFNAIYDRIKPNLKLLFDNEPKTPFEIRRTETFREKSSSAQYNPGSADGSRPGIFYVPIPDVKNYNVFSDEDLFLHEAIPGHHYQISLQQENKNLPGFRRMLWQSALGEGWALYTEYLGPELGLYKDPYQYFGMLSSELHRAIRLVVDVGIHAKGWTREEAIDYFIKNSPKSKAIIEVEVERYMALPGQALSYKIGQLKIIELRQKAEKTLSKKFNIKEFHNIILEQGCIPMQLLEERVNNWILSKQE